MTNLHNKKDIIGCFLKNIYAVNDHYHIKNLQPLQ